MQNALSDLTAFAEPTLGQLTRLRSRLDAFVVQMAHELRQNSWKGEPDADIDTCMEELLYHVAKLQIAVAERHDAGIREYSADVANEALFVMAARGLLEAEPNAKPTFLSDVLDGTLPEQDLNRGEYVEDGDAKTLLKHAAGSLKLACRDVAIGWRDHKRLAAAAAVAAQEQAERDALDARHQTELDEHRSLFPGHPLTGQRRARRR